MFLCITIVPFFCGVLLERKKENRLVMHPERNWEWVGVDSASGLWLLQKRERVFAVPPGSFDSSKIFQVNDERWKP